MAMDARRFTQAMRGLPDDAKAAFIRENLNGFEPLEVIRYLIDILQSPSNIHSAAEVEESNRELGLLLANLPAAINGKSDAYRSEVADVVGSVLSLSGFSRKFVAVGELTVLRNGDPRPACELLCRAINSGCRISNEDSEYITLVIRFADLPAAEVNAVIAFIREMRRVYAGNDKVGQFLEDLEADLKLKGLSDVWGPSLREQYFKELVKSQVIDKDTPILILGDTGTSKTHIAKRIIANSPFPQSVEVNAASRDAKKQIERGLNSAETIPTTVFIDEVYALSRKAQEYCLVEFGTGNKRLRVISASSRSAEFLNKKLVADFMARIDGWKFYLKPLAESPLDLEESIRGWARFCQMDIDDEIVQHIRDNYSWSKNHRDVKRIMEAISRRCSAKGAERICVDSLIQIRSDLDQELISILGSLI
jgi:hypothetical protein